jgi:hypothetical protein
MQKAMTKEAKDMEYPVVAIDFMSPKCRCDKNEEREIIK